MSPSRLVASGRVAGATHRTLLAVALALVAGLLPAMTLPPAAAGSTDAELRERRERLEAKEDDLEAELERAQTQREQVADRLSRATDRLQDVRGRLARLRDKVDRLNREIDALERQRSASRKRMAARVEELYKEAGRSTVTDVLSGQSLDDIADRSHYLAALSRDDREVFEKAAAARVRLVQRREELAETTDKVAQLSEQARTAQQELQARLAEAAESTEQARSRIARVEAASSRVEEMLQERAQATRAAADDSGASGGAADSGGSDSDGVSASVDVGGVEVSVDTGSDEAATTTAGGMACPQARPRSYSDTWGAPRSGSRTHEGTDIFGQMGGDVFAVTDGVIDWVKRGDTAGLWLALRADDGDRFWYLHLNAVHVPEGERVAAGEVIASNGDTGNARGTQPHIHFEYHPGGGGPVNPYPLVRRLCG